jgi:hypothetical protein
MDGRCEICGRGPPAITDRPVPVAILVPTVGARGPLDVPGVYPVCRGCRAVVSVAERAQRERA